MPVKLPTSTILQLRIGRLQPADFNWDYGFCGTGAPNEAVYRNGGADGGNITCNPAGYYLVTINTGANTCTIVNQEINPGCLWSDMYHR